MSDLGALPHSIRWSQIRRVRELLSDGSLGAYRRCFPVANRRGITLYISAPLIIELTDAGVLTETTAGHRVDYDKLDVWFAAAVLLNETRL